MTKNDYLGEYALFLKDYRYINPQNKKYYYFWVKELLYTLLDENHLFPQNYQALTAKFYLQGSRWVRAHKKKAVELFFSNIRAPLELI